MFAVLRSFAPAVLLLASLFGQAATGMVLVHVASEHAVSEHHGRHHGGHHHAADHHSEAEGEHADSGPDSEHTHHLGPATAAAPARIACPSIDVQPCLTVVGQGRFDGPAPSALHHVAPPVLGAGPPEPQRHPILLI
jgi:hypothetical protein